jgi:hypothetical protein
MVYYKIITHKVKRIISKSNNYLKITSNNIYCKNDYL